MHGALAHETATDELVAAVTSSLLGGMGGLHDGHQTSGRISDASQWLKKKGESFKQGVEKFSADRTLAWKKSRLQYLNRVDRRSRPPFLTSRESSQLDQLRRWMYNLKIAELEKAEQDRTLTDADRIQKQEEIDDMKENWRLWSKDEIETKQLKRLQGYDSKKGALTYKERQDELRLRRQLYEQRKTQLEEAEQAGTLTPEERIAKQVEVNDLKTKSDECRNAWNDAEDRRLSSMRGFH